MDVWSAIERFGEKADVLKPYVRYLISITSQAFENKLSNWYLFFTAEGVSFEGHVFEVDDMMIPIICIKRFDGKCIQCNLRDGSCGVGVIDSSGRFVLVD